MSNLFRKEVLKANKNQYVGTITLKNSKLHIWLTIAIVGFSFALISLFIFGKYTNHATLAGYIIPVDGIVKTTAPIGGRVTQVMVRDGQQVFAGEALIKIADDRMLDGYPNINGGQALPTNVRSMVMQHISQRQESLRRTIQEQQSLFAQNRKGLEQRLATLQEQLRQTDRELTTHQKRQQFLKKTAERYRVLANEGFVSEVGAQEKQEAVLSQKAAMEELHRLRLSTQHDISALQTDLAMLPMQERTQLDDLQRQLERTGQELVETLAQREVVVTAAQGGKVSDISVHLGYAVEPQRVLLNIIPNRNTNDNDSTTMTVPVDQPSLLEVNLFAQSKDIGFVKPGQEVLLRFQAYPYQKFGHYRATVKEISRTPLSPSELVYPATLHGTTLSSPGYPLFRIRAALQNQQIQAYGKTQPLQPGMQLEADVMLDTRTLLEWMLEPLFSLRRRNS